jgi:phosphoglucosamine mutase
MRKLPQVLINVQLQQVAASAVMEMDSVQQAVADVEATLADNGRVLLRPSGTEPLIRVMVEGREAAQVTEFANQIADAVRTVA